jgi:molybdopterin/thiamine biosynthesis adenylyltransferase
VTVCGAGALGANITENLARSGAGSLVVIDRDRIEERNLSTQPYYLHPQFLRYSYLAPIRINP